jgi:hypothetical protein
LSLGEATAETAHGLLKAILLPGEGALDRTASIIGGASMGRSGAVGKPPRGGEPPIVPIPPRGGKVDPRGGIIAWKPPTVQPGAPATPSWPFPLEGGGTTIGGRWFTEHALERMAPNTPEVMANLTMRALRRAQAAGLTPGTPEFTQWWRLNGPSPRGIPPSVVEAEIANPGTTGVRVITNANGDVVTVIPN